MTGLEIAAAGATIVQLIGQFKQERKDANEMTEEEFLLWLETKDTATRTMIQESKDLQTAIAKLLREDNRQMMKKMEELSSMILSLSAGFEEFRGIFAALGPEQGSEPLELLNKLVEADWRKFALGRHRGNPQLFTLEGQCGQFEWESQFLEQDLDQLANLGFFVQDFNNMGKVYTITRRAYKVSKKFPPAEAETSKG